MFEAIQKRLYLKTCCVILNDHPKLFPIYLWNKIQFFVPLRNKFEIVIWVVIYFATGFYGVKIISARIFICMCIPQYFYFSKYGCTFVTATASPQNRSPKMHLTKDMVGMNLTTIQSNSKSCIANIMTRYSKKLKKHYNSLS